MKKLLSIFLAVTCILCLTGCSRDLTDLSEKQDEMYIMPSQFSEETLEVLEVLDHEIQFFDISLNETAKSHTVSVWVYRDGQWHEDGKSYGETKFLGDRYAIRLTETSCELISMDENGHTRSTYPVLDTSFDKSMASAGWRLNEKQTVELNKEMPLWVMIGFKDGSFQVSDLKENFREIECEAGIAVTITVSDEVAD